MGGLGNQLFQYALGRHLAIKNKTDLILDLTSFEQYPNRLFLLNDFRIDAVEANLNQIPYYKREFRPNILLSKLSKYFSSELKVYHEQHFHFDANVLSCENQTYLYGYWQSEKYFERIKEVLLKEFQLKTYLTANSNVFFDKINKSNAVAVHVRRGDYIDHERLSLLSEYYYKKAFNLILDKVEQAKFFIFSDDISWCKEHFKFDIPFYYVESASDLIDFELMRMCKHHIIANSSFSWWAAYLSTALNQINVAPLNWFKPNTGYYSKDLYVNNWQTI